METNKGDKQEPDWVDRWSLKMADAVKKAWPPIRDWIKSCHEKSATVTRRAWPPTCDWFKQQFNLIRQRWSAFSPKREQIAIGIACGLILIVFLTVHSGRKSEAPYGTNDDTSPIPKRQIEAVEAAIASRALVPRSIEFAPIDEWKFHSRSVNSQSDECEGWVEAQNKFGIKVRSRFIVHFGNDIRTQPGKLHIGSIDVDDHSLLGGPAVRTLDGREWTPARLHLMESWHADPYDRPNYLLYNYSVKAIEEVRE